MLKSTLTSVLKEIFQSFHLFLFNVHSFNNNYLTRRQPLRSLLNRLNTFCRTFLSSLSNLQPGIYSWKVYGTFPSGHFLENGCPLRGPIIWPMVNSISPLNTTSVSSRSLSKQNRFLLNYTYVFTVGYVWYKQFEILSKISNIDHFVRRNQSFGLNVSKFHQHFFLKLHCPIYGLKFYLLHVHIPEFFFEIPPCTKKVIFVTELLILCKNPPFYEVNILLTKKALRIEEFHFLF